MKKIMFFIMVTFSISSYSQSGVYQRPNVPNEVNQNPVKRPEMTPEMQKRQEKVKKAVEECRTKTGFPSVEKFKSGTKATREQQQAMSECMRNSGALGQMKRPSTQGGRMNQKGNKSGSVEALLNGKLRK